MDKQERYLKEIAKNTAEIAKELKKMNREPEIKLNLGDEEYRGFVESINENDETIESMLQKGYRIIHEEKLSSDDEGEETGYVFKLKNISDAQRADLREWHDKL